MGDIKKMSESELVSEFHSLMDKWEEKTRDLHENRRVDRDFNRPVLPLKTIFKELESIETQCLKIQDELTRRHIP